MLDAIYFIMDLAEGILRGMLITWLVAGVLSVKEQYEKYSRWVSWGLILWYTTICMVVAYQPAVRKLLYGSELGPLSSRSSTLPMLAGMLLILLYCLIFYGGMRLQVLYLVLAAYSLRELILFTIHPLFSALFNGLIKVVEKIALWRLENGYLLSHFERVTAVIQVVWNLSFQIVFLYLLYWAIRLLKENLSCMEGRFSITKVLFLSAQSAMGLGFCMFLRSILFEQSEASVRILMDEYPETYVLIPIVSGLCVVSIISGAYLLRKLEEGSQQELLLEVYQNRIADMEEHMRDVERLYDGIRGMRHDMKNHVADLELLLRHGQKGSQEYQEELQRYFKSLYSAMEELEMPCHTGNPVTDVVLSRKLRQAQQMGIAFSYDFLFPEESGISAFDVSILLHNGLENALEAAGKEKDGTVKLKSRVRENMFFIEISNSFSGILKPAGDTGFPKSSKAAEEGAVHGYGLKNMKKCAEKYFGTVKWREGGGEFLLIIMLQKPVIASGKEKS